ncbi:hypothetical protein H310_09106 [Aphanomyces invadans]|uniref:Protein ENHANCED DISEASE RESISTANCE 2 C-terminal domain-containing protein n=1 Tax=Aphanomyces invadans TaxID=157072 RepID=A0A024TU95_9STRA|nr:hypothetical protein H310_09106 [Aphanomyces invadans]ETV97740.1 hypothetical protein H310_09106 [Aphanomyces invadans]|eukprot:XP_008873301.1 hypothetical protein H310_09106 [Aphanomyces invadans]
MLQARTPSTDATVISETLDSRSVKSTADLNDRGSNSGLPQTGSWKSTLAPLVTQHPQITTNWSEPAADFKVRSKRYLTTSVKEQVDEAKCELIWVDVLQGERSTFFHISQRPDSVVRHFTDMFPQRELFVLNILLPGTPEVMYAQYFALRPDGVTDAFSKLWRAFMDGTDEFRNARLKLIPRVVEGPWMIRKAVGSKPFILANALEVQWFRGKNYLEAVVDVSSDSIAKKVTSMCRMCVASLVVDMALVVEGQSEDELPEAILGCVRYDRLDMKFATTRRINQVIQSKGDSSDEEEEVVETKGSSAGFQFLLDDSDDSDVSSNDDKDSDDDAVIVNLKTTPPPAPSKKAKKKQAKKKNNAQATAENDDDDLLDALASQTNLDDEEKPALLATPATERNALLAVNVGALNADKEMKRLFGVKDARESLKSLKKGPPRNTARRTTKKVTLVTPDDTWPRPPTFVGGGIRWTRVDKPPCSSWEYGCDYFQIDWSIEYKKMQEQFRVLQMTHDPQSIVHFLHKHPYHVDALLQMAEVFQHHGQMDHSTECIKKCVYFMELAWGEHFSVNSGLCRMDFAAGDNKSFFRALFFLMRQVGRRGCVRSAFEIAKLIWSLDPKGDPMHVLLCLDYYALSARQCQFVVDLVNSNTEVVFRTDKSVAVPSLALVTVAELPGLQLSAALARYLLGDVVRATDDLAATLSKFPQVLVPLTEKCGITTTSKSWQDVICSAVFANAPHLDDNGIVSHLLHIYVTRHASLWKVNEIQAFLLQSATKASASYNRATFVTELPPLVHKYKRAISPDFSDDVTTLPPDHPMMMQPGQELDGMDLDVNNMDPAMIAQLQAQLEAEQARNGGNLPADAHPLLLFLQTLLPWNRIQQPGQRPANFDENPVYQPADE